MTVTSSNRTDISYVAESTPGTTPATPTFQLLPTTGGAPSGNLTTEISQVIRSDRATDDLIVVDSDVMADAINFELSYTPYKPIMDSLLQNDTAKTVAISASDISAVNSTSSLDGTLTNFVTENVQVGQIIRVAGFTGVTSNNRYYYVTSVASDSIGVYPAPADDASGETVTIDAVSRNNGTSTPDSFTFCKRVQGIANTAYFYYRGMQISQMVFNYQLGSILGGSFGLMGLEEDPTETPIAGQSFTAIPSYTVMSPATSVKLATIIGSGLSAAPRFESTNITINNNINAAKQIGTLGAADLASFTLDVTGDIRVYFEDVDQYLLFRNSTEFALALVSEDASGNAVGIGLPRCKFEELEPPIEGKDNFFMLNGSFRALYSSAAGAQVVFSHIAA